VQPAVKLNFEYLEKRSTKQKAIPYYLNVKTDQNAAILLVVMTFVLLSKSVQTQDGLDTTRGPLVEKSYVIPPSQTHHDTTYSIQCRATSPFLTIERQKHRNSVAPRATL
jgi:hypothetical protein